MLVNYGIDFAWESRNATLISDYSRIHSRRIGCRDVLGDMPPKRQTPCVLPLDPGGKLYRASTTDSIKRRHPRHKLSKHQ